MLRAVLAHAEPASAPHWDSLAKYINTHEKSLDQFDSRHASWMLVDKMQSRQDAVNKSESGLTVSSGMPPAAEKGLWYWLREFAKPAPPSLQRFELFLDLAAQLATAYQTPTLHTFCNMKLMHNVYLLFSFAFKVTRTVWYRSLQMAKKIK